MLRVTDLYHVLTCRCFQCYHDIIKMIRNMAEISLENKQICKCSYFVTSPTVVRYF